LTFWRSVDGVLSNQDRPGGLVVFVTGREGNLRKGRPTTRPKSIRLRNILLPAVALTEHGHRVGADLDFATPCPHIVWEPDRPARIEVAFSMLQLNSTR
jgi:hypothetical protein